MTEKGNLMEGSVQLGSIRVTTAADNPAHQQAFADTMRHILSDVPKEVVRVRPARPNSAYSRRNTSALTIHKTNARPPHPPHHRTQQAKA